MARMWREGGRDHGPEGGRLTLQTGWAWPDEGGAGGERTRLARLRAENAALRGELAELRDVRVPEMSHRIRNSLQLVAGLLRIQAADRRSGDAAAALGLACARVEAAARVHDLLCGSGEGGLGWVDLAGYLRETCASLGELLGVDGRRRSLVVQAEPAALPARAAEALGLVVVELVTNAFRHAFAADRCSGTVRVRLARDPEGRLELSVADDGAGLPADRVDGTGLRLVTATARQLGASLEVGCREGAVGGTRFALTLPAPSGKAVGPGVLA